MGAIVRKGGFGYPILVAIIFFMIFIILTILCKKISESQAMSAVLASWLPCLVLMPIGIWLTIKSMNDAALMNLDVWEANIKKLFSKIKLLRKTKVNPS
jgi:lipopolysaccharide export system permease protein